MTDGPAPMVSPSWLQDRLDDPAVRVLDTTVNLAPPRRKGDGWTVETARGQHDDDHVPGAQYADVVHDFSGSGGRFPRPSAEQLSAALSALGVGPDTHVVVYDRGSSIWAARLWWVLRSYGVDRASVLDGGFRRWKDEGRPTTAEPTPPVVTPPAPVPLRDRPRLFVDKATVLDVVEHGGAMSVNALDAETFTARQTASYARPGRIPGSVNVPAVSLVDDQGSLLAHDELRERLAVATAYDGRKIVYCGGGISASFDALALTVLGEQDVAVYDASYGEWAADPNLPVEVEPA